jgi:hypothetical protein
LLLIATLCLLISQSAPLLLPLWSLVLLISILLTPCFSALSCCRLALFASLWFAPLQLSWCAPLLQHHSLLRCSLVLAADRHSLCALYIFCFSFLLCLVLAALVLCLLLSCGMWLPPFTVAALSSPVELLPRSFYI